MLLFAMMIEDEDDRKYMHRIYEENKRLMFAIALRYTSSECDCEDIVHDTVEKLCKKVEKLKSLSEHALQAYIVSSVRNTAINFHKRQAIQKKYVTEYVEENLEEHESPHDRIERIEDLKTKSASLANVWNQLPGQDQNILLMKYVFDSSNEEIANALRCSKECIRMRLFRARKRALLLMNEGTENDKA